MHIAVWGTILVGLTVLGVSGPVAAGQPTDVGDITTNSSSDLPDEFSREIQGDGTRMVFDVDLSLLHSPTKPGSAIRVTAGGFANGHRVMWIDIGGIRTDGGLDTRSQTQMNLPV
ncbi:MAG: hypothetical protein ACLFR6_06765 [Salinarchaeum sp.]